MYAVLIINKKLGTLIAHDVRESNVSHGAFVRLRVFHANAQTNIYIYSIYRATAMFTRVFV